MKRSVVFLVMLAILVVPVGAAFGMQTGPARPVQVAAPDLTQMCGVGDSGNPLALPLICMSQPSLLAPIASKPAGLARPAQGEVEPTGPDSVVQWNRIARRVNFVDGGQNPIQGLVYIAYVQAAVYNAVAAIDGGYEQYKANLAPRPEASIDAAVATAAHDVLVYYFPAQQAALDADLATSLAAIPDGSAKTAGQQVGSEAAAAIIAERQNDGRNADIGFVMPAPAPGIWQLPAGQSPLASWLSQLRPFLLESPDQFRVGPAPDLASAEYAVDFNEVKDYGGMVSAYRTPEQTKIGRFWAVHPFIQSNTTLERLALTRNLDAMAAARLFAMADLVATDALVSCWDSKFTYLFWRPTFAIPQGDLDGNLDTVGDPAWVPLAPIPAHPEYPSAHGCATGSQAEVYAGFFGTNRIEVDISATLDGVEIIRRFEKVEDLRHDVINGRVWGGVHFRESVVKGANIGRKVTQWALQRYFRPVD